MPSLLLPLLSSAWSRLNATHLVAGTCGQSKPVLAAYGSHSRTLLSWLPLASSQTVAAQA